MLNQWREIKEDGKGWQFRVCGQEKSLWAALSKEKPSWRKPHRMFEERSFLAEKISTAKNLSNWRIASIIWAASECMNG